MRIATVVVGLTLLLAGSARAEEPPVAPPAGPPSGSEPAVAPTARAADVEAEASRPPERSDAGTAADLAAARAAAPETAAPANEHPARQRPGLPAETEVTIDRRDAFAIGLRFGGPTGAALRLSLLHGLGADVRDKNEHVDAVCAVPIPHCAGGFLLDAEAGSGGGKLSLGMGANAKIRTDDFRGTAGAGLKVSLARTWGSPIGTEPGLTYLGPELDLYLLRAGVSLGVLWRVAGDGGSSALFTWGFGFRL